MPGPPPKDPKLRQRRNKASTKATLPAGERPGRIPELPDRKCPCGGAPAEPRVKRKKMGRPPKEREACKACGGTGTLLWNTLTREWWRDVWRSPMSAEFLRADVHGLYRLADLVDRYWEEPGDVRVASEIRQQQQCYGLTPLDRRRLQWEMDEGKKAKADEADTAEPEVFASRDVLRALK